MGLCLCRAQWVGVFPAPPAPMGAAAPVPSSSGSRVDAELVGQPLLCQGVPAGLPAESPVNTGSMEICSRGKGEAAGNRRAQM